MSAWAKVHEQSLRSFKNVGVEEFRNYRRQIDESFADGKQKGEIVK